MIALRNTGLVVLEGGANADERPRAARMRYADAAAYLGIPVGTLRALVSRKQVPHVRLGARLVVFDRAALDAWLRERAVDAR